MRFRNVLSMFLLLAIMMISCKQVNTTVETTSGTDTIKVDSTAKDSVILKEY